MANSPETGRGFAGLGKKGTGRVLEGTAVLSAKSRIAWCQRGFKQGLWGATTSTSDGSWARTSLELRERAREEVGIGSNGLAAHRELDAGDGGTAECLTAVNLSSSSSAAGAEDDE